MNGRWRGVAFAARTRYNRYIVLMAEHSFGLLLPCPAIDRLLKSLKSRSVETCFPRPDEPANSGRRTAGIICTPAENLLHCHRPVCASLNCHADTFLRYMWHGFSPFPIRIPHVLAIRARRTAFPVEDTRFPVTLRPTSPSHCHFAKYMQSDFCLYAGTDLLPTKSSARSVKSGCTSEISTVILYLFSQKSEALTWK